MAPLAQVSYAPDFRPGALPTPEGLGPVDVERDQSGP